MPTVPRIFFFLKRKKECHNEEPQHILQYKITDKETGIFVTQTLTEVLSKSAQNCRSEFSTLEDQTVEVLKPH